MIRLLLALVLPCSAHASNASPERTQHSGGSAAAAAPKEDSYRILERIVKFGNRHAGAPKRRAAVDLLARLMTDRGLKVSRHPFQGRDPKDGRPYPMVNLVGRVHPGAKCRFLLGSHFDIRHVAENDPDPLKRGLPIQGANDGSSGVAVLLSLASRLDAGLPSSVGADIVLFDGEEMGYPDVGGYCLGSWDLVSKMGAWKAKPRFGVILDMVCDPRGVYRMETNSLKAHPALVQALWSIGRERVPAAFQAEGGLSIIDDHFPLTAAGVPSVLIIGFNYPEFHTTADTLERCSAGRLALMEDVLWQFVSRRLPEFLQCAPPGKR
ncbi:MAG: M28 family peptidase [Elusimicrobiota bacterium]